VSNPHRDRVNELLERSVIKANFEGARRVNAPPIDWHNIPDSALPKRNRRRGAFLPYLYRRRGYIMAISPQHYMDLFPEMEEAVTDDRYSLEIMKRWHNHEFWSPFRVVIDQTKQHWRVLSGSPFDWHSAKFLKRRGVDWVLVQAVPEDDSQATKEAMENMREHGLIPLDGQATLGPIDHIKIAL
jgi:hypothetical protein